MSRRRILVITALVVVGIVLPIVWLLTSDGPVDAGASPVMATGISMFGYAASGDIEWETTAASGKIDPVDGDLSTVTLRFYSDGRPSLVATGGLLLQGESGSELRTDVSIEREDGLRLQTDALHWDKGTDSLDAGRVSITWNDISLDAERFEYDLRTQTASLTGGILMTVDRSSMWVVQAKSAELSEARVYLEGDVAIDSTDEGYRCERMEAETEGDSIRLMGEVEAQFPDGRLTAERARIDADGLVADGTVSILFWLRPEADGG